MIVKDKGLGLLPVIMAALEFARQDSTFTLEAEDPQVVNGGGGGGSAYYPPPTPKLSTGAVVGLSVGAVAIFGTLLLVLVKR